jgi:hypothetical protein
MPPDAQEFIDFLMSMGLTVEEAFAAAAQFGMVSPDQYGSQLFDSTDLGGDMNPAAGGAPTGTGFPDVTPLNQATIVSNPSDPFDMNGYPQGNTAGQANSPYPYRMPGQASSFADDVIARLAGPEAPLTGPTRPVRIRYSDVPSDNVPTANLPPDFLKPSFSVGKELWNTANLPIVGTHILEDEPYNHRDLDPNFYPGPTALDGTQFGAGPSPFGTDVSGASMTGGSQQYEDGSTGYSFANQQGQDIPADLDSLIMDEILMRLINPAGNVLPEQANAHRGMAASRAAQAGGGSTQDVIQRLMGDVRNSDARRLRERGNNVPIPPAPEPHPPGVPLPQMGPSRTSLFGATANPKQPTYINNSIGYDDFGSVVQNTGSAEIAAILAAMANPLMGLPNFFDPPSDVEMVYSSADGIQPSRQSISDYLYDQAMQDYDPFAGPPDTSVRFDDSTGSGASIGGAPTQGPARVPPWQVLLNGPSKTTQQGSAGATTTRPRRTTQAAQRQSTPRPAPAPAPAPSRGTAARTVAAPPPASTPTRGTAVRKAGAVPRTVGRSR